MTVKIAHRCTLARAQMQDVTKLVPNASLWQNLRRTLRKFIGMNINHYRCKTFFRKRNLLKAEWQRNITNPYPFLIHPFSIFNAILEVLFFFAWFYTTVTSPIMAYEDSLERFNLMLVHPLQWTLMMCFFFTGYIDKKTKAIIMEPKKIFLRYFKSYFLVDVLATGILDYIIAASVSSNDSEALLKYVLLDYLAKILAYVIRLHTLISILKRMCSHFKVTKKLKFVIMTTIKVLIYVHLFSNSLISVTLIIHRNSPDLPPESLLMQMMNAFPLVQSGKRDGLLHVHVECFLTTLCYFFGSTYGNYRIIIPSEQVILTFVMVFGRLYTLFLLADILKLFGLASNAENNYESYLFQLDEFMQLKNLPENLRKNIKDFYRCKFQGRSFKQRELRLMFSENLKEDLFLFGARKLLKTIKALKYLNRTALSDIILIMKTETFTPNDVITKVGDKSETVYFIESGTVAVVDKDGLELCHLEDGDDFGISSFLPDQNQNFKHVAVETTQVYCIERAQLMIFLENHPSVLNYFQERVKERLLIYQKINEKIQRGGTNVLEQLQRGMLLEHLRRRPQVAL